MDLTSELNSDLAKTRGYADHGIAPSAQLMSMYHLLLLYKMQLKRGFTQATLLRR